MKYKYIGKGTIKYLDKEQTKLGAFLEIDTHKACEEWPKVVKIQVLPNKDNTEYNVKMIIEE